MAFNVIIAINVVLYFARFFISQRFLISEFALYPNSEFYTFFTCMFMHSDFNHLLMNMVMLFMAKEILKYFNIKHLLIVYFAGGVFSSLLYYLLMNDGFILLGASGAISALFGFASIVLRQNGFLIAIAVSTIISIIFFKDIAWQAHIFGVVFGIIYAYVLKKL